MGFTVNRRYSLKPRTTSKAFPEASDFHRNILSHQQLQRAISRSWSDIACVLGVIGTRFRGPMVGYGFGGDKLVFRLLC